MTETVKTLRSGKERLYAPLMIIVGILLWILIALVAVVALGSPRGTALLITYGLYALVITLAAQIFAAAYRATAFGNMMLLGPDQFPELHGMVQTAARDIGLAKTPSRSFTTRMACSTHSPDVF